MLSVDTAQYPVPGFRLPEKGPRGAGFTSIFGLRQPRFMKNRTANTTTISTTMASTIVVRLIGVLRNAPDDQARRASRLAAFVILVT